MHRTRHIQGGYYIFAAIVAGALALGSSWAAEEPGYQRWQKHRDRLRTDPSVLAYYTFENVAEFRCANLAGDRGGLYSPEYVPAPGRWPQKPAVRIGDRESSRVWAGNRDRNLLAPEKALTLEFWFRPIGGKAGPLAQFGWGVFADLWKLRVSPDKDPVQFGIRCAPGSTYYTYLNSKGRVVPGAWNHLVATWDGKTMSLYLNGAPSGTSELKDGPPSLVDTSPFYSFLRFGGTALCFDLDEAVIYRRALSAEEAKANYAAGAEFTPTEVPARPAAEMGYGPEPGQYLKTRFGDASPAKTGGYYPAGSPIPLACRLSAAAGPCRGQVEIVDAQDKVVLRHEQVLKFEAAAGAEPIARLSVQAPERCGIYWLRFRVLRESGELLKAVELPLGVMVALPPLKELPESSPMGGHDVFYVPQALSYGLKWERAWCSWKNTEKERGSFDWKETDHAVDQPTQAGQPIMLCMDNAPDWAREKNVAFQGVDGVARDMEDWKRFLTVLVQRYKDRVHCWEIYNEPNGGLAVPNLTDRPAVYVKLLKAAYETIKAADPQATVVGICGAPGYIQWTEEVLKAGGGPYFDVLSFHNYCRSNPNQWMDSQRPAAVLNELLQKHARRTVPLWDTESAFHQPYRIGGRPMTEEQFSKEFRAEMLPRENYFNHACLTMIPERRSAAWEVQHSLLSFADGIERRFLHICGVGVANGYPVVYEKGVALAALAKVVSDRQSVRALDLGTSRAKGVLVTDKALRHTAALWSVDERPVNVTLLLPDRKESFWGRLLGRKKPVSGMDYLGNPLALADTEGGALLMTLRQEPVYLLDVPADLAGMTVLEVQGTASLDSAQPAKRELTVRNPFDKPLKAILAADLPKGWQIQMPSKIALQPRQTIQVPITLMPANADDGVYPVGISLAVGGNLLATAEPKYLVKRARLIPRAKQAIVLDGDPAEWAGITAEEAREEKNVMLGRRDPMWPEERPYWKGPDDLSFKFRSAWAPDGIYMLIEVTDDKLLPAPPEAAPQSGFLSDCVELFVNQKGYDPGMGARLESTKQFLIIPAVEKGARGCRSETIGESGYRLNTRFVGKRTDKGYVIEGVITPAPGNPQLKMQPGAELALDVAVDDADEASGARKTQIFLHSRNQRGYAEPNQWGWYRLVQ